MKNKTFLIWIVLTLLVLAISLLIHSQTAIICWDGLDVDESLLTELCGLTPEEYFGDNFNLDDCPAAVDALRMTGGCETDWSSAWMLTAFVMIVYLLLSGVFFLIRRLALRKKAG